MYWKGKVVTYESQSVSPIIKEMLGKKVGDIISIGNANYEIANIEIKRQVICKLGISQSNAFFYC